MAAILIELDEDAETIALENATQTGKPYRWLPRD